MNCVWFRNDLRLLDNTAWERAEALGGVQLALYIDSPSQDREHDVAPIKQEFKQRCVEDLKQRVEALGVAFYELTVETYQAIPEALLAFAQNFGVEQFIANREYALNEEARDKTSAALLREHGVTLRLPHDQAILPPGSVLTQKDSPYTVFTPFYRNWAQQLQRYPEPPEEGDYDIDSAQAWPAGEQAAWCVLRRFCESRVSAYNAQRDFPAVEGTSQIAPYLAIGVLSPRVCVQMAINAGGGTLAFDEGVETWVKELAWRDFYIHILHFFPRVSRHKAFKEDTEQLAWRDSEADFAAWCEGRTGIPIVDAAMRQLNQTGWMHNRLRMITAMFLTKHLLIDWRRGERYFMSRLVDGHLASNNGGWQWAASTGTDSAPYFRIFNPVRQSEKFDKGGEFIRRFVPELAKLQGKAIHGPTQAQRHALAPDYPAPIVNLDEGRKRALAAFKAL